MEILQRVLFLLGGVLMAYALLLIAIGIIFDFVKRLTGRTRGTLVHTKHKRNVTLYSRYGGETFIPHLTFARYFYTVGQRSYSVRDFYIGTPRQTPFYVSVLYIKHFPRFSYVRGDTPLGMIRFGIRGLLLLVIGLALFIYGIHAG